MLDEKDLQQEARVLARKSAAQCLKVFIELHGDLGAGKTTFARAFIDEWLRLAGDAVPSETVSPTYNIVRIYGEKKAVAHLDLYRLKGLEELEQIGFERYFYEYPCVLIEWPEQIEGFSSLRPRKDSLVVEVQIRISSKDTRELSIQILSSLQS